MSLDAVQEESLVPQSPIRNTESRRERRRREARQRRRRLIVSAVGVAVLSAAALVLLVLVGVPRLLGAQTYTVLTPSMEPTYPPGTFLVVRPVPFEDLRAGDVVTYQLESGQPEVVTHRVESFAAMADGRHALIARGDSNALPDPPVFAEQLRGRVAYAVPGVGWVSHAVTQAGLPTVAGVALLGYGGFTMTRAAAARIRTRQ